MAHRTAMIDVGGGFRAIYGAGVMDRMLEDGISVDHCYGVSAGSANMVSFIAKQHGRNHTFYTQYAFRKEYASFDSYVKNHNFANLDYVYSTLSNHDGENPVDYAAFEANPTGFTVVACNAEDGSTKYFGKSDVGYDNFDILKASSAVPVACEPYAIDGVPYYDGGIADPVPIVKSLHDGNRKNLIVLTQPKGFVKKKNKMLPAIRARYLRYPAFVDAVADRHERYNETLAHVSMLEQTGKAFVIRPPIPLEIGSMERDAAQLRRVYDTGRAVAEIQVDKIAAFVNESKAAAEE